MRQKHLLYTIRFYSTFAGLLTYYYVYGMVRNKKTATEWRVLSLKVIDGLFKKCNITVCAENMENIPDGPVIFCANHQSYLDGLIISHITRRPFVAITAPFHIFPFLIGPWFRKMQYFEVARDIFEELKYKSALHHDMVISQSVARIKGGESLLLFPEGTREYKHRLLPFHLGVAKISHQAKTPIVPLVLKNADKLFPPGKFLITPTKLKIVVETPIECTNPAADNLEDTIKLEEVIMRHLPKRYLTQKSIPHHPNGTRAAFFDLDGTLTKKNIYVFLLKRYLRKTKNIKLLFSFAWLSITQLRKKHGYFYQQAIKNLQQIDVDLFTQGIEEYLTEHADKIFFKEMLEVIRLHQQEDDLIFLISEEPEPILKPIAAWLGLPCIGTRVGVIDGKFDGKIIGHIMKDHFKHETVIDLAHKYKLDLEKSFAYGNSVHDMDMLRTVTHATLVNPSKKLKKYSKKFGFKNLYTTV